MFFFFLHFCNNFPLLFSLSGSQLVKTTPFSHNFSPFVTGGKKLVFWPKSPVDPGRDPVFLRFRPGNFATVYYYFTINMIIII